MQDCISDIKLWMTENKLKLNDDKTEVLLVHNTRSFKCCSKPDSVRVGDIDISFAHSARNLGFILSDDMSLDAHVTNICRAAYIAIRQISCIRQFLTVDATKTLLCAFVLSRLDYCNSLLAGSSHYITDKLQKVQNSAARLVFRAKKRDHVTPLLQSLHWLPVEARIQYKIYLLCHNFFHGVLIVPKVRTKTLGERSFAFCGPKHWNSLPDNIRSIKSTPAFKKTLKTYLFKQHYNV